MAQSLFEGLFVVKVSTFQLEQPATAVGLILDDALSCQICLAAVSVSAQGSGTTRELVRRLYVQVPLKFVLAYQSLK